MRERRGHDLRHTMISLSRSDGALKDILKRGTHAPSKEVIEGYTHFEWDVLCREVAKLKLTIPRRGQLLALSATGTGGQPENPRSLEPRYSAVTAKGQQAAMTAENDVMRAGAAPGLKSPGDSGTYTKASVRPSVSADPDVDGVGPAAGNNASETSGGNGVTSKAAELGRRARLVLARYERGAA